MKKLIFCTILLNIVLITLTNNCKAQIDFLTFRKLGIIAQLTEIKYISEAYLASIVNDPKKTDSDKKDAIRKYNIIRLDLDRIIYQMIADMTQQNSPKLFKQLNEFYKTNTFDSRQNSTNAIKPYCEAFATLYSDYDLYILPHKGKANVPSFAEVDITAIFSLLETTWKDIEELRSKKVEGITDILKNMMLPPVDKEEKKDDKK